MAKKKRYILICSSYLVLVFICYFIGTWSGSRQYSRTLEESRSNLAAAKESEQRAIESAKRLQEQNSNITKQLAAATKRNSELEKRITHIAGGVDKSLHFSEDIGKGIDDSIREVNQSNNLLEQFTKEFELLRDYYTETK